MNGEQRVRAARNVIVATVETSRVTLDFTTEAAQALEYAGLLQSPETAAELTALREACAYLERHVASAGVEIQRQATVIGDREALINRLRAERVAADFPVPYALTGKAAALPDATSADRLRAVLAPTVRADDLPEPRACSHCDIPQRDHAKQWATGVEMHAWAAPDDVLVVARMVARREARRGERR